MSKLFDGIMRGIGEAKDHLEGKTVEGLRVTERELLPVRAFKANDIKSLRKRFGFSQKSLALLLGVSVETIRAWEKGYNAPSGPSSRMLQAVDLKGGEFLDVFYKAASR